MLWRIGMKALSQLPHVHVKLSGYAMFFGADLGETAHGVTRDILELFGADRVMFGSNFPVDKLHLRYDELVRFIKNQTDDVEAVLSRTAAEFYGLPL